MTEVVIFDIFIWTSWRVRLWLFAADYRAGTVVGSVAVAVADAETVIAADGSKDTSLVTREFLGLMYLIAPDCFINIPIHSFR